MLAPQTYPPVKLPTLGIRATPANSLDTAPAHPPAPMPVGAPPALAPPPGAPPAAPDALATGHRAATQTDIVDPINGDAPGTMIQTYGTGGKLVSGAKNYLQNLVSDPGPAPVDTSPLGLVQAGAQGTQNQAIAERKAFQLNPTQAPSATDIRLVGSGIDPIRAQQQQAIAMLQSAANGSTPSAAELQQQQAGNRAAAQQFGMASALQGGLSPAAALRQASEGAANLQADTANNNAQLRAQEMAGARGALVQGLAGVRGQEQDLAGQNAGLAQQTNLANLNAQLTTTGQNQDWQKALLQQQENALNAQTQGATGLVNANAQAAASANQYNSGYIQQGKQLASKLLGR